LFRNIQWVFLSLLSEHSMHAWDEELANCREEIKSDPRTLDARRNFFLAIGICHEKA